MQHAQTPNEKNINGTKATLPRPTTAFNESMFLCRLTLCDASNGTHIICCVILYTIKIYFVYSNENNNKFDFQLISGAIVLCTNIFFVYFYTQVKLHDNGVDFGQNPSRKKTIFYINKEYQHFELVTKLNYNL